MRVQADPRTTQLRIPDLAREECVTSPRRGYKALFVFVFLCRCGRARAEKRALPRACGEMLRLSAPEGLGGVGDGCYCAVRSSAATSGTIQYSRPSQLQTKCQSSPCPSG